MVRETEVSGCRFLLPISSVLICAFGCALLGTPSRAQVAAGVLGFPVKGFVLVQGSSMFAEKFVPAANRSWMVGARKPWDQVARTSQSLSGSHFRPQR